MQTLEESVADNTERLLVERLIAAQKLTVVDMLSNTITQQKVIESVNHAAWLAQTMANRCADPEQPPVACKAKCHWCCNQYVRITAPEAFRVANYVREELPLVQQEKLLHNLSELMRQTKGLDAAARGRLNHACSYIYRGKCVIYAARPLMCQRQTSYKVSDCRKAIARGFPFGSIMCERASLLTHNACIQGLSDGFEQVLQRGPLEPLEMISATLTALTEPECFERWLNGEAVFKHCTLSL
ncbi:hypothetical protein P886_0371 [Alteromonadaceae bacterium 2753L.S.0a.02]|nr:hypothetical protein P886_0371 [Alteromonadaceae bacterium 2753L.S.0a.02]